MTQPMKRPNPQHNSKPKPFSRAWRVEQSRKLREGYASTYDFTSRRPVFDGGAVFVPDAKLMGLFADALPEQLQHLEPMKLPNKPNYHFRAVICGHCFTCEARLPDC